MILGMDQVVDFIHINRDRYVEELKQYLAIPSVSALPQHKADVRRCAEWTADELRRIGLQNVKLIDTPGNRADMPDADPENWVTTADLASVVMFLCSKEARAIHGALIPVVGLS